MSNATANGAAPLVSVVMPSYNQADYIAEAIASVQAQTFGDWELIVIDDGSRDNTGQVVAGIHEPRLRYVYQDNQERSRSRNNGIRLARGQYIAFLDADDLWLPEFLEKQLARLAAAPQAGMSFTGVHDVDPQGRVVLSRPASLPAAGDQLSVVTALMFGNRVAMPGCALVRAECLAVTGGFDEHMSAGEDWELWLRLALRYPLVCVPEPLVCYRRYFINQAARWSSRGMVEAYERMVLKAFESLDQPELAALKPTALGQAYWRGAWLRNALGASDDARALMTKAREQQPEFFAPPFGPLVESVAYLADEIYDLATPLDEALTCIARLFANLPEWAGYLRPLERAAAGQYCGLHVFRAYERRQWPDVRRAARLAVANRPGWLANRGFRSVIARAYVPALRV